MNIIDEEMGCVWYIFSEFMDFIIKLLMAKARGTWCKYWHWVFYLDLSLINISMSGKVRKRFYKLLELKVTHWNRPGYVMSHQMTSLTLQTVLVTFIKLKLLSEKLKKSNKRFYSERSFADDFKYFETDPDFYPGVSDTLSVDHHTIQMCKNYYDF